MEQIFFGGRRSGVHGDARNDDEEAIFDTPVLNGGVRYASSVFVLCALKPKEVYSKLRFSIFGATPP